MKLFGIILAVMESTSRAHNAHKAPSKKGKACKLLFANNPLSAND